MNNIIRIAERKMWSGASMNSAHNSLDVIMRMEAICMAAQAPINGRTWDSEYSRVNQLT